MTTCVCSHDSLDHHAWTGACYGGCGCSYFDDGETTPGTPCKDNYEGIYARKYTLGEAI